MRTEKFGLSFKTKATTANKNLSGGVGEIKTSGVG